MEFTPDVWTIVIPMLKPRHLYKLMRTNKTLLKLIDNNEDYWTRVAAHLVWRGDKRLELKSRFSPEKTDLLPVEEQNLYNMIGIGYKQGMDRFIQRIQMAIDANTMTEFNSTLRERTLKYYIENTDETFFGTFLPAVVGDEQDISMKELARRVSEQDGSIDRNDPEIRLLNDLIYSIEDTDMPAAEKRLFFSDLETCVSERCWKKLQQAFLLP